MAYLVRTQPRAERDLESIFLFIEVSTSAPAMKWFVGLVSAIEALDHLPNRHPRTHENPSLRHILYGRKPHIYRVIYAVDPNTKIVDVLHVRHHSRSAHDPASDQP